MGRLFEFAGPTAWPQEVALAVGDLLSINASGARFLAPSEDRPAVVELLGPFMPSVMTAEGQAVMPAGAPNTILVVARMPGRAVLEIITGDPWGATTRTTLEIEVVP
jgi:hypothetical protein